jgi:hypothetical protein
MPALRTPSRGRTACPFAPGARTERTTLALEVDRAILSEA